MSQSKQGEPGILSRLWPPFLFVLGCLLVAGIYYFFYVDKKSSYLMSRDFRYLATIGKQTREAVDRQGKIFSNLALKPDIVSPAVAADPQREKQRARYLRDLVPLFENVLPKSTQEWGWGKLLHRIEATPDGPRLAFFYAPPKAKSSESEPFVLTGGISFEKLLGTYFQSRGAFESILLANHEATSSTSRAPRT